MKPKADADYVGRPNSGAYSNRAADQNVTIGTTVEILKETTSASYDATFLEWDRLKLH